MTVPALQQGDFVWCAFPEREAPLRPGPLHVAYTLAVASVGASYGVMTAYTTSQPWSGAMPHGVIAFDSAEAASLGQARAFVLDVRRLAYLPLTVAWFPRLEHFSARQNRDLEQEGASIGAFHALGEYGAGVLGRAPKALRDRVNAMTTDFAKRRPESFSRSGPLWGPAA